MDEIKASKKLGTNWFTFYTKVRPWFSCLMVFSVIVDFIQYVNVYVSNWWMLLYLLAAVAHPILSVIVAVKSSGDYADFVCFVKGVLLFETINTAYQQGVQQYISTNLEIDSALIIFVVVLVITYFVWYRLNVKYFEKRIDIFTNDDLEDNLICIYECKTCGYRNKDFFDTCPKCWGNTKRYVKLKQKNSTEYGRISFCRKCGEKLISDNIFCSKCGTKVIEE